MCVCFYSKFILCIVCFALIAFAHTLFRIQSQLKRIQSLSCAHTMPNRNIHIFIAHAKRSSSFAPSTLPFHAMLQFCLFFLKPNNLSQLQQRRLFFFDFGERLIHTFMYLYLRCNYERMSSTYRCI